MVSAPILEHTLESVFRRIQRERMQDMPMCNAKLQVQAVGFQPWGEYLLGVMITPWFMNLMLLPRSENTLRSMARQPQGAKQSHDFPSGRYEFINGREAGLNHYQTCSLFSPLPEFDRQSVAVAVAQQVLCELLRAQHPDGDAPGEKSGEQRRHREDAEGESAPTMAGRKSVDHKLHAPLSRRAFLRGRRDAKRDSEHGD